MDDDIKIADDATLKAAGKRKNTGSVSDEYKRESESGNTEKAKAIGEKLAKSVIEHLDTFVGSDEDGPNDDVKLQRGILMTFSVTVALEQEIGSSVVSQTAKQSFNGTIEKLSPALYRAVSESGAFSFYYLAYRRGTEVDRRIGQTFAMLCSHDGDPIYQELGEAIYCWFISSAQKQLEQIGL